MRVLWAILGVPSAFVAFLVIGAVLIPVGGGAEHLMFAYSGDEGNVDGAKFVFAAYTVAELAVLWLLARTRYPGWWLFKSTIAASIALFFWLPFFSSTMLSEEFVRQGMLFAALLIVIPFVAGILTLSTNRLTHSRFVTWIRPSIAWSLKALAAYALIVGLLMLLPDIQTTSFRPFEWLLQIAFMSVSAFTMIITEIPLQIAVFALWLQVTKRRPALEATLPRRIVAAFILALPIAFAVMCGMYPNDDIFDIAFESQPWYSTAFIPSVALASAALAIWITGLRRPSKTPLDPLDFRKLS